MRFLESLPLSIFSNLEDGFAPIGLLNILMNYLVHGFVDGDALNVESQLEMFWS